MVAKLKDGSAKDRVLRCVGKKGLAKQWEIVVVSSETEERLVSNVDVDVDESKGSRRWMVGCKKSSVDSQLRS